MAKRHLNHETVSPERKACGKRLTDERIAHHWTQKELSKRANVHSHVISNIESGHTLSPTAEAILRIARVFNLRPEWLLDGTGEKYVPGPVEVPEAQTITVERVPIEFAKTVLKVVEEMQYSRLFCPEQLSVSHVERWLGALLAVPEMRSIGDHFLRAAVEEDPTLPGSRPVLVVNNVSLLPDRTVASGVVLPEPEKQPAVVHKTASLRVPPADRKPTPEVDEFAELGTVLTSLDPNKGVKLGRIKKGSYTDITLRKRAPMRRDGKLRQGDVCALLGISLGTFWTWQQNDPSFPKPVEEDQNGKATAYNRADFEHYLRMKLLERKREDARRHAHA